MPHRTAGWMSVGLLLSVIAPDLWAQRIRSPEVHGDGRVTLRLLAPGAEEVSARIARVPQGELQLEQGDGGLWEGTTEALPAGIHEYSFQVDGVRQIDPHNRWIKKWYSLDSLVEIPGTPPLLTELREVPHGVVHHHYYTSPHSDALRSVMVYTPPGYDSSGRTYPVLFLLHGFGDDQTAWTEVGRAHLIADNLLAASEMEPMVIVMPHGHPEALPYGERPTDYGIRNDAAMQSDLIEELVPLVSERYRVDSDPRRRAIVGLSMGGGHALRIGLEFPDYFAWVGAFSAATPPIDQLSKLDAPAAQNRELLWIACGKEDFLVERNREFVASLEAAGIPHQYEETGGGHNWSVWRDYLPRFLGLLFQSSDGA